MKAIFVICFDFRSIFVFFNESRVINRNLTSFICHKYAIVSDPTHSKISFSLSRKLLALLFSCRVIKKLFQVLFPLMSLNIFLRLLVHQRISKNVCLRATLHTDMAEFSAEVKHATCSQRRAVDFASFFGKLSLMLSLVPPALWQLQFPYVGSIYFIASYSKCFYTRVLICSSLKLFCFSFYVLVDVVCKVFFQQKKNLLLHAGQLCNVTHIELPYRRLLSAVQMTFMKSCRANLLRKHYNVIYNLGNCSEHKSFTTKGTINFSFRIPLRQCGTLSTQRSIFPSWKCIKQV